MARILSTITLNTNYLQFRIQFSPIYGLSMAGIHFTITYFPYVSVTHTYSVKVESVKAHYIWHLLWPYDYSESIVYFLLSFLAILTPISSA